MDTEHLRRQVTASQRRLKVVFALLAMGLLIEMVYFGIGIALGISSGGYLGNTKATRDAAEAGSGILSQAGSIAAVSTWLEAFKFVGIAFFFAAIGTALSAIVHRVRIRGQVMQQALPVLMRRAGQ